MIKLVIFDLDGTLLNTIDDLANSCNYILEKNGFQTYPIEAYKKFVGGGVKSLMEKVLPENILGTEFFTKIMEDFIAYYSKHSEEYTAPYNGVLDMLKLLENQDIKLAVASNKFDKGTKELVGKYFSEINFVSVLGQREGIAVKPDPHIIHDIINYTEVSELSEVLYIGDSGVDMQTAVNASVKSVGVLWGFRDKEELLENGAEYLVETPSEIIEIINGK